MTTPHTVDRDRATAARGHAPGRTPGRASLGRRIADAAQWLTTPLLPEDYLGMINPLWSTVELRGRIEAVRPETADAATLVIRPGRDWTGHRPGQWLRIGIDIEGVRHWRSFSLSSPARPDGCVTITVKAASDGFVSRRLVHHTRPGTIVRLDTAQGEFVLPERLPEKVLFLTAGSGITPVMAMLRDLAGQPGQAAQAGSAAQAGRAIDILMVHSAPTADDVIFGSELREIAARIPGLRLYERHTETDGRVKLAELADLCPDWAERETWACGPADLLDEVTAHWESAGVPERLNVEHFRPVLAGAGGEGGRVRFNASGVEADAGGSTPLLEVGENAGALLPSGCRMGICYSCVGRLCSGQVRDLRTGEVHGEEGHLIQTCVSAAAGPVEIEL